MLGLIRKYFLATLLVLMVGMLGSVSANSAGIYVQPLDEYPPKFKISASTSSYSLPVVEVAVSRNGGNYEPLGAGEGSYKYTYIARNSGTYKFAVRSLTSSGSSGTSWIEYGYDYRVHIATNPALIPAPPPPPPQFKRITNPLHAGAPLGYSIYYGAQASTANAFCRDFGYWGYKEIEAQDDYGNGHYYYKDGAWHMSGGHAYFKITAITCSDSEVSQPDPGVVYQVYSNPTKPQYGSAYRIGGYSTGNGWLESANQWCKEKGFDGFSGMPTKSLHSATSYSWWSNGKWNFTGGGHAYLVNSLTCSKTVN